ncbi:MAG: hypothetical protein HN411_04825 [Waddliaceae bacterium]|nr:hypothetical protein [Waddliaceae bacterium]MBT3578387.1 hypothetical protein [Waddliaceae bacterium]MBT6928427.1 hypothetical protein [Waddliaceae bacterium]MBT7264121.1 hypothetical protein [Waddliaceae bacterium]
MGELRPRSRRTPIIPQQTLKSEPILHEIGYITLTGGKRLKVDFTKGGKAITDEKLSNYSKTEWEKVAKKMKLTLEKMGIIDENGKFLGEEVNITETLIEHRQGRILSIFESESEPTPVPTTTAAPVPAETASLAMSKVRDGVTKTLRLEKEKGVAALEEKITHELEVAEALDLEEKMLALEEKIAHELKVAGAINLEEKTLALEEDKSVVKSTTAPKPEIIPLKKQGKGEIDKIPSFDDLQLDLELELSDISGDDLDEVDIYDDDDPAHLNNLTEFKDQTSVFVRKSKEFIVLAEGSEEKIAAKKELFTLYESLENSLEDSIGSIDWSLIKSPLPLKREKRKAVLVGLLEKINGVHKQITDNLKAKPILKSTPKPVAKPEPRPEITPTPTKAPLAMPKVRDKVTEALRLKEKIVDLEGKIAHANREKKSLGMDITKAKAQVKRLSSFSNKKATAKRMGFKNSIKTMSEELHLLTEEIKKNTVLLNLNKEQLDSLSQYAPKTKQAPANLTRPAKKADSLSQKKLVGHKRTRLPRQR